MHTYILITNVKSFKGPKLSDYHIVTTDKPDDMSKVLSKALGIRGGNAYFFK